jgi:hypothetical protein
MASEFMEKERKRNKKEYYEMEWVSEWLLFNVNNFSAISWLEQVTFQWYDDEVSFVLDQHAELNFLLC